MSVNQSRRSLPPSMTPQSPFAKMGQQVINTIVDVVSMNHKLNASNPKYYPKHQAGMGIKGSVTRQNIESHGLREEMDIPTGTIVYVPREGYSNSTHKRGFKGKTAAACIPVFGNLAGAPRLDGGNGVIAAGSPQDELNALLLEQTITPIGWANAPDSTDSNDGAFTTHIAGPLTVVNNGSDNIWAGDTVAARVPRLREIELGNGPKSAQAGDVPILWHVRVDPTQWDLHYRPLFERTAEVVGDRINAALAIPAGGMMLTKVLLIAELKKRILLLGWSGYEKAVATLLAVRYVDRAVPDAGQTLAAAVAGVAAYPAVPGNVTATFDDLIHKLDAVREIRRCHDRTILGVAQQSAPKKGEFLIVPDSSGHI